MASAPSFREKPVLNNSRRINNSFVFPENNFCVNIYGGITDNECITIRGGAYITSSSNTHHAGTFDDTVADSTLTWGTKAHSDFWKLNEHVSLEQYTFGVPTSDGSDQMYKPQALLGLGRNSTLLQTLLNNGLIASRSWSYYWGLDGRGTAKTNGSLVLGGYDQDKVTGTTNYTTKLNYTSWCPWGTQIEISDIRLEFLNNTFQTLFDEVDHGAGEPSLPLYACIDPGQATMFELPYVNYMFNFVKYTHFDSFNENGLGSKPIRSKELNWWNLMYLSGVTP